MNFTLEELYNFANVSQPGGNHYTVEESEKVWNTEKGKILLSLCKDNNSFSQYFLCKKIYGAMAQRYSGVLDTNEYDTLLDLYTYMTNCTFPFGYTFSIWKCKEGVKIILQKEDEPLEYMNVRIGVEYYSDIPDKIHRPPYTTKVNIVQEYLTISLSEFQRKMRNKETTEKAIQKLRKYESMIEKENIQRIFLKLDHYDRNKLIDIIEDIKYEFEDEYTDDYGFYTEKDLINIIKQNLEYSSYSCIKKFI
jgi:hypothetical protein